MGPCLSACRGDSSSAKENAPAAAKERDYTTSAGPSLQKGQAKQQTHRVGLDGTHQAVRLLGRGAAGEIWLFRDVKTRKMVAVKLFERPLDPGAVSAVLREIKIQTEISEGHINLIKVYDLILTPTHLGLVMEAAQGGSLTSYVADKFQDNDPQGLILSEDESRYYFKQFVSAVAYCHKHCIAHRDLKLDNTLLDGRKPACIKICDFGFARDWTKLDRLSSKVGTIEYMSPELLHNGHEGKDGKTSPYDPRSTDVWAAGVMLVVSLCGAFPYDHTQHHHRSMQEAELDVWMQETTMRWRESEYIKHNINKLSPECQDLLDKIFQVDPKQRITLQDIQKHPWYTAALSSSYQGSWDQLEQEQQRVDNHIHSRELDMELVTRRMKRIEALVQEATTKPAEHSHSVRPLHTMSLSKVEGQQHVDLTEASVLQQEGSQHRSQSGLATSGSSGTGVSGKPLRGATDHTLAPNNI